LEIILLVKERTRQIKSNVIQNQRICTSLNGFLESFEISSKNESISFISLDPSELEMQIFHHRTILGGSWSNPKKHLIAILASDSEAKPIQILPKFIKDLKLKTISPDEFISSLSSEEEFIALKNQKQNSLQEHHPPT